MKTIQLTATFQVYSHIDELESPVKSLMEQARQQRDHAYAPYSNFHVGAALRLANGEVVVGSNQENAAYPSGLCAERVAIFQAGARFPGVAITHMAICAGAKFSTTNRPIPPCGACRQSIAEYENNQSHPIDIYFMGETGEIYRSASLENLLPLGFDKNFL